MNRSELAVTFGVAALCVAGLATPLPLVVRGVLLGVGGVIVAVYVGRYRV